MPPKRKPPKPPQHYPNWKAHQGKHDISLDTDTESRRKRRNDRRQTVWRKSYELATITGGKIFVLYTDHHGQAFVYTSCDELYNTYKTSGLKQGEHDIRCDEHNQVVVDPTVTLPTPATEDECNISCVTEIAGISLNTAEVNMDTTPTVDSMVWNDLPSSTSTPAIIRITAVKSNPPLDEYQDGAEIMVTQSDQTEHQVRRSLGEDFQPYSSFVLQKQQHPSLVQLENQQLSQQQERPHQLPMKAHAQSYQPLSLQQRVLPVNQSYPGIEVTHQCGPNVQNQIPTVMHQISPVVNQMSSSNTQPNHQEMAYDAHHLLPNSPQLLVYTDLLSPNTHLMSPNTHQMSANEHQVSPSIQPVAPGTQPVTPSIQPVVSSAQPVAPSIQPVAPGTRPVAPSRQPVTSITQPVASSTQPVAPSTQPVIPSIQPVVSSAQPVAPSIQPVASSVQPVESSAQPVASSSQPVESSTQPVAPSIQPVASSAQQGSSNSHLLSHDCQSQLREPLQSIHNQPRSEGQTQSQSKGKSVKSFYAKENKRPLKREKLKVASPPTRRKTRKSGERSSPYKKIMSTLIRSRKTKK